MKVIDSIADKQVPPIINNTDIQVPPGHLLGGPAHSCVIIVEGQTVFWRMMM